MASQRDVRNRIAAVKNIQTITRAMEMVAAARLRRAEQRIDALRPYAEAIRRMTRQAASAAGHVPNLPIMSRARAVERSGCCSSPVTAGSPGAFNSQIVRAGVAAGREHDAGGRQARLLRVWPPSGLVAGVPRAGAGRELHRLHGSPRATPTRAGSPSA